MKPRPRLKPIKIVDIDLQVALDPDIAQATHVPPVADFEQWASTCAAGEGLDRAVLALRIVDEPEMAELNGTYRQKAGPTNVLSFPCDLPAEMADGLIGDVIICAPVVAREAQEQGKRPTAHWCHMLVHGILHVLGYDHEEDEQARLMEAREREILAELGFDDPYRNDSATDFAVTEVNISHNE